MKQITNAIECNIAQFRKDHARIITKSKNKPIKVTKNNKPLFYCFSNTQFKKIKKDLEDLDIF